MVLLSAAPRPSKPSRPDRAREKPPVPSRAQQSSRARARVRGDRQQPLPFARPAQRACAQPARSAAHGGGVCRGSANVRPGEMEWETGVGWAGGSGEKREGARKKGKWGEEEGRRDGSAGSQRQEGGGWAGWVPKALARAKDNAPECRECL